MTQQTAILVGASGLVGGHCLNNLLSDTYYRKVVILVRRPLGRTHPTLEEHVVDFDDMPRVASLLKGGHLFCSLGTTRRDAGSRAAFKAVDLDLIVSIFRAASQNGISRAVLISTSGAGRYAPLWYCRLKAEMEDRVSQLPFESLNILRPSLFLGKRPRPRLGETIGKPIMLGFFFVYFGPFRKYKPIQASVVAAAMTALAKRGEPGVRILESDRIQELVDAVEDRPTLQRQKITA